MRLVSWRRRRSPGGRRPVCARRCNRRRPRNSVPRSCATSPRTSPLHRVRRRSMATSRMRRRATKAGSPAIWRRAPACSGRRFAADAARCSGLRPMPAARGAGIVRNGGRCRLSGELRQPDLADCNADPGGARAAGAGRADCAWPGRGRRLLPAGHAATPRAPVRRHRLEHEQRCRRDARAGRGAWPRRGDTATWYDVDDAASLDRLLAGADDGYAAPATNAWIERSGLRGRLSIAAQ